MSDLEKRLRAASHDDRLSTGMLYREAADELSRLRERIAELEAALRHERERCARIHEFEESLIDPNEAAAIREGR